MKKTLLFLSLMSWAILILFPTASCFAEARPLLEGAFDDDKNSATIFVQNIEQEGVITSFGLIILRRNPGANLYRIEPVEGGQSAWIRIHQSADNLLATVTDDQPDFMATWDNSEKRGRLRLSPTARGDKQNFSEMVGYKTGKYVWLKDLENSYHVKDSEDRGYVDQNVLSGNFKLSDKAQLSGRFQLTPFIPGVYLVRRSEYDGTSSSGLALSREILAILVFVKEDDWGMKTRIKFLNAAPTSATGWSTLGSFKTNH